MDFAPISKLINQGLEEGVFPGGAISIGNEHGEIWRSCFGYRSILAIPVSHDTGGAETPNASTAFFATDSVDVKRNCYVPEKLPVEATTLFDLASVTKVVATTMVTLALVAEGKLKLDETLIDICDRCPAFASQIAHICPEGVYITIERLLTHTSELPAHVPLYEIAKTPGDVVNVILEQELSGCPCRVVEYSCLGFILLGKICEALTGEALDRLAQRYVFEPLGLKNTMYNPCAATYNFAATEYCAELGQCLNGVVHDENARFMGGVSGNAGVFADISDCATLATMLAAKGRGVIPRALFEEAIKNHTSYAREARGLGFALNGPLSKNSYGHTGFTGTSIWVDAETSYYVVFLTNRVHPSRENRGIIEFRRRLHECFTYVARRPI